MTYPKYLSTHTSDIIESFVAAIMALEEGTSLLLQDSSPQSRRHLRDALYTWLNTNNIKQFYRISSEGALKLRILRRPTSSARIVEDIPFSTVETFVMDNLLETDTLEKAMKIIAKGVVEEVISKDLVPALISEWRRIQGKSTQST